MKTITVAIVDDHVLLRRGLAALVDDFEDCRVLFQSDNGKDFINDLSAHDTPDIVLLDINMPEMDGYETALWIRANLPLTKVLALSMYDNDTAILRMIKSGARGYVLKDSEPEDLRAALSAVATKGYYYTELVTGKVIHALYNTNINDKTIDKAIGLSDREIQFLKLVCTELTYKEIADQLFLSPRTVDGYRDALFEKLNVKTRVGLVIYALKHGIVAL